MKIKRMTDVKLSVDQGEEELIKIAKRTLKTTPAYFKILKKSLDARDKENVRFVYTFEFSSEALQDRAAQLETLSKEKQPKKPVVIVGSGPAGLFCALRLLARGIKPYVIERGDSVEVRTKKIETFCREHVLDTESNVQFGEGGAGTFSDGKLNTGTHGGFVGEVLKTFVSFGAPAEIEWLQKPHIGSDKLKTVVKNMREYIEKEGGRVEFNACLKDIRVKDGALSSIVLHTRRGEETIEPSALVLAIGHSSRDTFEMLLSRGVFMKQKDFAVGARIEHLQKKIGLSQYGKAYKLLPAADYKLVSHASERAAFTFCMCPGGVVMPAASEEGGVVTNGMSNYARDGKNADAALIVQVTGADFKSDSPLAGVEFQRRIERAAFLAGGKDYKAPVQLAGDFLNGRESSSFGSVSPTYALGTTFADLNGILPPFVTDAMRLAIADMDRKLKGFADSEALLTAPETRTSSPVRIERGTDFQSVSVRGVYPCGEGAGYAGGITSSASDGIRVADVLFSRFSKTNY